MIEDAMPDWYQRQFGGAKHAGLGRFAHSTAHAAADTKKRLTDAATSEQLLRIVYSLPT